MACMSAFFAPAAVQAARRIGGMVTDLIWGLLFSFKPIVGFLILGTHIAKRD